MIEVINVKITDHRLGHYHRSPWFQNDNRFDTFKYCLASRAALAPIMNKFILFIDLAEFSHRRDEMEQFIYSVFPREKVEINWYRLNYTREWRAFCDTLDDNELMWFDGNDDHIFSDYDLDMVQSAMETIANDPDPLAVVYYAHWPEQMRNSLRLGGQLTTDGNFIKFQWENFDCSHIMKMGRFKKYWFETDCGDSHVIFRTDSLDQFGLRGKMTSTVYSPTRELLRHYDGYSHVGLGCINIAPPVFVPPGFFEGDMKIRIGFNDRKEGWITFNPAAEWLYAANPAGIDYRWVEEDIPLFWRSRISEIVHSPDYDRDQMYQARDAAFLAMTSVPMNPYGYVFHNECHPPEWFAKHLRYKKDAQ
jgi:hypothetical protein